MVQGQDVVHPFYFEKSIGEARLLVSNGVKQGPVNVFELGRLPVVDATEMLNLGSEVSVGE